MGSTRCLVRVATLVCVLMTLTARWTHASSLTFQHGLNGYTGTVDTYLNESHPNQNYSTNEWLTVDASYAPGAPDTDKGQHSLLRFDGIVGSGPGQIPVGSVVQSASLTLYTIGGSGWKVHEMIGDWSESATWESMGSGVQANNTEASTVVSGSQGGNVHDGVAQGTYTFDSTAIRATVQGWVDDPASNKGWALLPFPQGWNGLGIASAQNSDPSLRPKLDVTFVEQPPPRRSRFSPATTSFPRSPQPPMA